jgi:hypothetical protein
VQVSLFVGWSSVVVVQMFSGSIYAPSCAQTLVVNFVHDHPMYIVCPDVLSTVGETANGIRVGFIGLDEVLTIFLLTYYLYLRCKVCSCPVNQIKIIFQ